MSLPHRHKPQSSTKRSVLAALVGLGAVLAWEEVLVEGDETCFKPASSTATKDCPVSCKDHACVPCVTYTDDPSQPDWGCSDKEPLCVVPSAVSKHAPQIGTHCAPYPCRKTTKSIELRMDEGCTQQKPRCVDALQQDVLPGAFGMECIEEHEHPLDNTTEASSNSKLGLWGMLARNKSAFGVALKESRRQQSSSDEFEVGSLCNGCPLSGQGRTCESTKACDTLGGVHTTSSTTHPAAAKSGIYSW